MKTKKVFSLILALATLLCAVVIPANAAEAETHEHIEIIIENENISEETKAKIIAYYTNGEKENEETATYGLTCTLFGHKLEASVVSTVTHKARSSAPRCLEKIYDYESCTRCDYENSVLASQKYIYCC
ncbi:MAG: hypothetical protein UGF89_03110 [Acutalibacteraceae bacterium]|nr:hypothetical protein [Acutalibacteraceae bacterium]